MSKNKQINYYKRELKRMMTDSDITRYLGQDALSKIIKYSELQQYKLITDLITEDKDWIIILTEDKPNSGHWCCLIRINKDKFEWFDSYGVKPDGELKYIPWNIRVKLGESKLHLTRLMRTIKNPIYSIVKYQQLNDDIATCGRWIIARILTYKFGYTLDDFEKLFKEQSEETGKPFDILIVDYIK